MTDAAARAVDLFKQYGSDDTAVVALDHVSIEFGKSEFTAIMGPSGSGKSTLMHTMAGLDSATSGSAFIGDTDMSALNVMFSAAVSVGTRLKDWKIKPSRSRRSAVMSLSLSADISVSPINAEPEVAESKPAIVCISVDLPEPDGPMIAVNSFLPNSMDT